MYHVFFVQPVVDCAFVATVESTAVPGTATVQGASGGPNPRSIPSTLRIGASIWRCSVDDLRHSVVRLANWPFQEASARPQRAIWCRLFGRRSLRSGPVCESAPWRSDLPRPLIARACFGRRQHLHRQTLWLRSVAGQAAAPCRVSVPLRKGLRVPLRSPASGRRNPPGAQCGMGAQAPNSCQRRMIRIPAARGVR
jgi:hypothetical protein